MTAHIYFIAAIGVLVLAWPAVQLLTDPQDHPYGAVDPRGTPATLERMP
ncbi:MAG: hypothetical protein ACREIW_03640 [Chthoniobacterales bacterium]